MPSSLRVFHRKLFVSAVLMTLFLSHCTSVSAPYDASADSYMRRSEASADERRIAYAAQLHLVAKEPDTLIATARRMAENAGGYLVRSSELNLVVQVPADRLEPVLDQMADLGKVRNRNLLSRDITEEYADMEIRLENATKARNRYLQLLDKAETVADIIAVERELERLNTEIERLQSQQTRLDEQEAFSQIDLRITPKEKIGPLGYVLYGAWKAIKWLF